MEKIILDCDPGHDDAIAMIIAAAQPQIELLGVTTVAGNQTVDKTTRNALSVCAAGGFQVPVARGCDRPMVQPQVIADDIHGETGLDGPVLPDPTFDVDPRGHAQQLDLRLRCRDDSTSSPIPRRPPTSSVATGR